MAYFVTVKYRVFGGDGSYLHTHQFSDEASYRRMIDESGCCAVSWGRVTDKKREKAPTPKE